ncbi:SubName: Full=Uncharacterized protein {ECO:0000313/EMBL:CCA72262.1} [Serendipita indica DSM 11827]|uniref:C2H2-type domain-containing protein n=1 Tax=Serendipita indica (strain DSM 11827) TaxID=1109443 RepID=G4TLR7_SERID|nr:SubName: Full=Uncharacterized protein {ECO:0000313/EMBL:CCA72262.1} [Serendipita indica DSM 11827]CCA72262.1 hypothetical protein PIIN_06196 [Serendipita indica DSM 11827]
MSLRHQYHAQCDQNTAHFATTRSSSRCSTPSLPSPPSPLFTGALDQVFGAQNPYIDPLLFGGSIDNATLYEATAFVHPMDLHSLPDPNFGCIIPPDLHFASPMVQQTFDPQPPQTLEVTYITSTSDTMQPLPQQSYSVDLPKRKGDRALARLHRSAVDPDRHWACDKCIQKFSRKSDLTRHLKRHSGIKDYPCTNPACPLPPAERAFFRADARRRHWSRSPACESEFYKTPEGVAWIKKNSNRRGVLIYQEEPNDDNSDGSDSPYAE